MLEQFSARIMFMLLDVSLKGLLLGALAALVMVAFRGMSVHARHRVWTVVLLTLLLLPILGLAGLSWTIPVAMWPLEDPANHSVVVSNQALHGDSMGSPAGSHEGIFAGSPNGGERGADSVAAFASNGRPRETDASPRDAFSDIREQRRSQGYLAATSEVHVRQTSPANSINPQSRSLWTSWFVVGSLVWMAGVGVMWVRLLLAFVQMLQFKLSSRIVQDDSLPAGISVRECHRIDSPVVVGWWQPCILLPADWRDWTNAKREAVFSHELSHLRRRDTQLSLLAELATLVYWFHPVSWLTKRKLSQLAELACDEAAAVAIGNRVEYARYLVEIAAANRQVSRLRFGTAMARSSETGQRVRALLDMSKPLTDRISWTSLALIFLLGLPAAIVLAAVHPTAAPSPQPTSNSETAVPPLKVAALVSSDNAAHAAQTPNTAGDIKQAPSPAANQPPTQIDEVIVTIRGTLLMPDGSVAKDAVLERPAKEDSDIVSATIVNGQFEVKTTGTKVNSDGLLCRTPDWNHQALLRIREDAIRGLCAAPQRITLAPAKLVRVAVSDGGQAVPDAHVQFGTGLFNYFGKTRANGVVELKIAHNQDAFLLGAWTDDYRVGGWHAAREPSRTQFGTDFQIEISRDEPVRVQVVDDLLKPVANVPLWMSVMAGDKGEFFAQAKGTSYQTANDRGEAVFKWAPKWPGKSTFIGVVDGSAWRELGDNAKTLPDGTLQLQVAPSRAPERILVEGQLAGVTSDVTGMFIELWGSPGEKAHSSDLLFALTDAQGRYRARVLPGSKYSVFVDDLEFVSNNWRGVIVLANDTTIQKPQLTLSKGVHVEVLVTKGRLQEPVKNAWVHLHSTEESGSGRQSWRRTDDKGRATAQVTPGELQVRIDDGDWEPRKTIQVIHGQPAKVLFHRRYTEEETITGKLVLPPGTNADLSGTTVKINAMDGESQSVAMAKADAQGNFTAKIIAGRVSILALSPDEKFFGRTIAEVSKNVIEVPCPPTLRYAGQLLGPDDQPLSGAKVHMLARLIDHLGEYPPGTHPWEKRSANLYKDRTVTTDKFGYFVFPTAPRGMDLQLGLTLAGQGNELSWNLIKQFEPGVDYSLDVFRIPDNVLGETYKPKPAKPLPLAMADTILDAKLAGIHALVIVSGAGDIATPFIARRVLDDEKVPDVLSYLPRKVNGPESATMPDRREYFAAHQWPFPEENSLFLAALDGEGKELGRMTLNLRDDQTATKEVAAFLKQHLPPKHDAKAEFDAALAEAKTSGRRLWVRVGGTRCSPCFSLSRWLASQRELLAKDYVLFKFDSVLDLHGQELRVALKLDDHGIPCHAILDGDGKELVNSIGPKGDIGSPCGDPEGIAHIKKMLKTTAQKLTDAEIESLIRSIPRE